MSFNEDYMKWPLLCSQIGLKNSSMGYLPNKKGWNDIWARKSLAFY